ncbi:MAG TPA: S24 family peptidase [Bacteroidales bacterium]|nr:S24 family peptidase [Bacteroidales bacterium]
MQEKNEKILSINERIFQILDFYNVTRYKFSQETGISEAVLLNIYKGKNKPSYDFIEKLLNKYEVNADWLITGNGTMVKNDLPVALKTKGRSGIPLIPITAMAGAFTGDMQVLEHECDHYVVPVFKGADFLISVKGNSMYPKYSSGDIVACKKLPLDTFFQWNKVYVLDTDQGPLIKRVKKGKTDDTLLIVSDNEKYDPFELQKKQIHNIALVLGAIRLE